MSNKILLLGTLISVFLATGLLCAHQANASNLFSVDVAPVKSQISKLPTGFYSTNDPSSLPLPTSGYRVYLVGEAHGYKENETIFLHYLSLLYRKAGLHDIVLEEDQVYEDEAQAFVTGKQNDLPEGLCHRANILEGVRRFNQSLHVDRCVFR